MRQVEIKTREIYDLIKNKGYNSKDIGNHYLDAMISPKESASELTDDNGFMTKAFEKAWDWQLGIYLVKAAQAGMEQKSWLHFIIRYDQGWYRLNHKGGNIRDIKQFIH